MIGLFQYYRIAAAYLILLIHQQFWVLPSAMVRLTGAAVPLFAAMAGFLFAGTLGRGDGVKTIFLKKAKRILVPYAVWAVVYWVANCVVLDVLVKHEPLRVPGIRSWLLGGTACHLWFLPCLFLAFALYVIGGVIFNRAEHIESSIYFTRLRMIAFDAVILILAASSQFIEDSTSATFAGYVKIYLGRLMFYFALGALIKHVLPARKIIACIIGGGMILIGYGSIMFKWIDGLVWNPFLFVIGLLMVAMVIPKVNVPVWAEKMAEASMGIYLVHVLFTSGVNFILQKIGYATVPLIVGLPLTLLMFVAAYFAVLVLPR